ncbi:MAG: aldo/keto reductase, partial [Betaproteobacteria bacterium]
ALPDMVWMQAKLTDAARNAAVAQLQPLARELGCSVAQLAIAWAARNPRVSTVIMGASRVSQLQDNLGALQVLPKLSTELVARIETITAPLAQ